MIHNMSGIYLITVNDDRYYVGQAQNIQERIRKHLEALRSNKHKNSKLQNYFNKYGESAFEFTILNECSIDDLDRYEQTWLDIFREYPTENILNICFEPNTTRGYKFTQEQKDYLKVVQTGIKKSPESKINYSKATSLKWSSGVMKPKPRKRFMIVDPSGVLHEVIGIDAFAKYHGLSSGSLHGVISGKSKQYRGYTQFNLV